MPNNCVLFTRDSVPAYYQVSFSPSGDALWIAIHPQSIERMKGTVSLKSPRVQRVVESHQRLMADFPLLADLLPAFGLDWQGMWGVGGCMQWRACTADGWYEYEIALPQGGSTSSDWRLEEIAQTLQVLFNALWLDMREVKTAGPSGAVPQWFVVTYWGTDRGNGQAGMAVELAPCFQQAMGRYSEEISRAVTEMMKRVDSLLSGQNSSRCYVRIDWGDNKLCSFSADDQDCSLNPAHSQLAQLSSHNVDSFRQQMVLAAGFFTFAQLLAVRSEAFLRMCN